MQNLLSVEFYRDGARSHETFSGGEDSNLKARLLLSKVLRTEWDLLRGGFGTRWNFLRA
jgi:hypothetical protein